MRRLNAAELEDLRDIITFLQTGGGYALGTVDAYNVANRTSAFGELLTVQPSPKAAWRFDYGINTDLVTTTIANAGALTYADVNATNSPVEVSTTTTTITSTETVAIFTLSEGSLFIPFNGEVFLQPGETLTIGVVNSGVQSTDVSGTMNWAEEF